MKKIYLIAVICIFTINTYAQTETEVTVGNKTFIKSVYSDGRWYLMNKGSNAIYESQYKGKEKSNDRDKQQNANDKLRLQGSNADILAAIRSVFTSDELSDLKDERVNLVIKINNDGKIILIHFAVRSPKLKTLSLSKFSLLEDNIISSMTFKIPDKSIYVYTIFLPLKFSKLYNNTPLFPDKAFN